MTDARQTRSYGIANLASKDELAFKALMRLLDKETVHKWFYSTGKAHLMITGDALIEQAVVKEAATKPIVFATQTLKLTSVGRKQNNVLCLPLFPNELRAEINRIGNLLSEVVEPAAPVALAAPRPRAEQLSLSTPSGVSVAAAVAIKPNEVLKLKRWPPSQLVLTRDRMRLATFMMSGVITLQRLQLISGQSPAVCESFVNDLKTNGLLTSAPLPTAPVSNLSLLSSSTKAAPARSLGLLARIRNRLGISGA